MTHANTANCPYPRGSIFLAPDAPSESLRTAPTRPPRPCRLLLTTSHPILTQ